MKRIIVFTIAITLSGAVFASDKAMPWNTNLSVHHMSLSAQDINKFESDIPQATPFIKTETKAIDKVKGYIAQDYVCPARYDTEEEAEQAMFLAKTNLEKAGAVFVMYMKLDGFTKYSFMLSFAAKQKLIHYTAHSSVYVTREGAKKNMLHYIGLLKTYRNRVISAEIIPNGSAGYTYHVAYFPLIDNKSGNKFIKVCVFNEIKNNSCVYKCAGGSTYIKAIENTNQPNIVCPQIVFPF